MAQRPLRILGVVLICIRIRDIRGGVVRLVIVVVLVVVAPVIPLLPRLLLELLSPLLGLALLIVCALHLPLAIGVLGGSLLRLHLHLLLLRPLQLLLTRGLLGGALLGLLLLLPHLLLPSGAGARPSACCWR